MYADVAKLYGKNESTMHDIVKREKKVVLVCCCTWNTKVTATVKISSWFRCKRHEQEMCSCDSKLLHQKALRL